MKITDIYYQFLNPIDLIEEPIIIAKEIEFAAPIIIVRYIDY